ncbi:3-phosphoglycerate kinase [Pseudomonas sp. Marseille-P9899]|uniref:3-phosphoglycerate kinase n=1 Tax=Pseudomonas sp. Marseille-P9899 TaxID=2730401 RepID=UPI00158E1B0B|nr:3-phosphoglycerate kinase [Pseudomonas sp. Marseille-P9899]
MKKSCLALLALLPLTALGAYPIDVEKHLESGIKIDAAADSTAYNMGAITLNNYGDVAARCKLSFRNGPEAPRVKWLQVPAKQSARSSVTFNREILRLRIAVDCKAQ